MLRRFFSQAWLSFKGQQSAFSFEEILLFKVSYPLITLIFYCVLAGYSFRKSDLTHWVVGNSFLLCINTCIFSLGGTFSGERYFGRLRSIIVAPVHKISIILQKGFYPCIAAVLSVMLGFFMGSLIFGVDFTGINPGLFLLITIVAMFAATGFGMLLAVLGLITDEMNFILNLSSYVLMIFCGANFPISQLPLTARLFSKVLPLTRSIEAANMLFDKIDSGRLTWLLIGEMGLGIVYCIIGTIIVKLVEKSAIKKAALEVF